MCVRRTMSLRENVLRCVCGAGGPVRRVLFGRPDREQLQRDFSLLMKKDLQEASHRWSFDFSSHKPLLGGDLEWEELPASRVPALYRDCTVGAVLRPEKENIPETPEGSDGEEKTLEKQRHALKRKQTNITDFYQSKRRVVATSRKSGQ